MKIKKKELRRLLREVIGPDHEFEFETNVYQVPPRREGAARAETYGAGGQQTQGRSASTGREAAPGNAEGVGDV